MKSILPHQFFIYASNFSIKSMLKRISQLSFEVFNDYQNSELGHFAKYKYFTTTIGNKSTKRKTLLVQTWLIDMMYEISCLKTHGNFEMFFSLCRYFQFPQYCTFWQRFKLQWQRKFTTVFFKIWYNPLDFVFLSVCCI